MRILIAEDDSTTRALISLVLKKGGHQVEKTTNGLEAWNALQQPGAPTLAILDWMMPEMDGLQVIRRVRSLPTDRPPYLIMLTSKTEKMHIIEGLKAGANDYLPKPFDAGELLARVEVGRHNVEMRGALADMNKELRRSKGELVGLRLRLSMSEHDERRRIAASLHDCSVQDLVAIQLGLNQAVQMMETTHPGAQKILTECAALAGNNANELRSLAYDLHAPWLDHGGVLPGINEFAHRFSERTGICVSFQAPHSIPRMLEIKEIAIYRVMQESLMNIHRHSGASQASISISVLDQELHLSIRDNGRKSGISRKGKTDGMGIMTMYERMGAIGGKLDLRRSSRGVSVLAIVSLVEEIYGKN